MFLKFNCLSEEQNMETNVILFHVDAMMDKELKSFIQNNRSIKICLGNKKDLGNNFD